MKNINRSFIDGFKIEIRAYFEEEKNSRLSSIYSNCLNPDNNIKKELKTIRDYKKAESIAMAVINKVIANQS